MARVSNRDLHRFFDLMDKMAQRPDQPPRPRRYSEQEIRAARMRRARNLPYDKAALGEA